MIIFCVSQISLIYSDEYREHQERKKNSTIEAKRIGYTWIGEQNESYSIFIAISIAAGCIFF